MRTVPRLLISVLLVALLQGGATGTAGQALSAADLFQEALHFEEVKGDLHKAIEIYARLAEPEGRDATSRAVAARALLRMGGCYETLGMPEARRTYERVLREYADQPEPRRLALERLEAIFGGNGTVEMLAEDPAFKLLRENIPGVPSQGLHAWHLSFAPTGERYVFRGEGSEQMPAGLYISDIGGTFTSPLVTEDPGREVLWSIGNPSWSPDGNLIAFTARDAESAGGRARRIYVVPAAGGAPRPIGDPLSRLGALVWTPDSRRLTYEYGADGRGDDRRIGSRDLDGRVDDIARTTNLGGVSLPTGYSPEGRWLALTVTAGGARHRDIWLLPAGGGPEAVRLTNRPRGFDGEATWSRDGQALYFVSDRSGSDNIWKLGIDPESGQPRGEATQVTFYSDLATRHPKVVTDEDGLAFVLWGRRSTIRVADASSPESPSPFSVRGRGPALSPDGSLLYYVGEELGQQGIYVVPGSGGTPRRLTESLPIGLGWFFSGGFRVSPDGDSVVYAANDADGVGIFTVSRTARRARRLVSLVAPEGAEEQDPGMWKPIIPQWSPDGSKLAYNYGDGLYVIAAGGGTPETLAKAAGWHGYDVRWSPDGRYVAAVGHPEGEGEDPARLYVVPASGGDLRLLTPPEEDMDITEGLEWHPDGDRLTYMMYGSPTSMTRVAYLDGRPPTTMLDVPDVNEYWGLWEPSGRYYYFSASRAIYRYDAASGSVTLDQHTDSLPAWNRDGSVVALTTLTFISQLWLMEETR